MTRHSKNATAGPSYTYHEKQKDSKSSGWGSQDVRLSKDAIKEFDCCSLTLQPCKNPVITQDGYLFDKEAILEYILHQKTENLKKQREFEKYNQRKEKEIKELADLEKKQQIEKFLKTEGKIVSSKEDSKESKLSVSNMNGKKGTELPSFWIPSLVPSSKADTQPKKPNMKVYCPMSGKPISIKDLYDVKFKLIDDKDNKSLIAKSERYVCAVTNDVLGNSVPCVVLKPSGCVVTQECYEKLIKKDMIDPINGKKLIESDVISIQRGGTGFAGSGVKLVSKKITPAMIS